jgi:hypothetical protein
MDLSSLDKKSDIVDVALMNPRTNTPITNEDGTPMTISVSGKYSKVYREILDSQQNARIKRGQRNNKMTVTVQEIASDRLDLVSACTSSWNITLDGEKPVCDAKTAKVVYERFPFIREQVEDAMEDIQNFLT